MGTSGYLLERKNFMKEKVVQLLSVNTLICRMYINNDTVFVYKDVRYLAVLDSGEIRPVVIQKGDFMLLDKEHKFYMGIYEGNPHNDTFKDYMIKKYNVKKVIIANNYIEGPKFEIAKERRNTIEKEQQSHITDTVTE